MNTTVETALDKKTIGFIVEGKSDANFIKYLFSDYFKDIFDVVIIPVSGKSSIISSARIIVSSLVASGVNHIFILFDTDNNFSDGYIEYIQDTLNKIGMSEVTSIIPIDPFLEIWILSNYLEEEELYSMDRKSQLKLLKDYGYSKGNSERFNKNLNFEKMKKTNKNFYNFIRKIESKFL